MQAKQPTRNLGSRLLISSGCTLVVLALVLTLVRSEAVTRTKNGSVQRTGKPLAVLSSPQPLAFEPNQGQLNREVLKRALFYGGVMGSFAVERFGTERLQSLTRQEIDGRFQVFRELTHLE